MCTLTPRKGEDANPPSTQSNSSTRSLHSRRNSRRNISPFTQRQGPIGTTSSVTTNNNASSDYTNNKSKHNNIFRNQSNRLQTKSDEDVTTRRTTISMMQRIPSLHRVNGKSSFGSSSTSLEGGSYSEHPQLQLRVDSNRTSSTGEMTPPTTTLEYHQLSRKEVIHALENDCSTFTTSPFQVLYTHERLNPFRRDTRRAPGAATTNPMEGQEDTTTTYYSIPFFRRSTWEFSMGYQ
jgi:hypothetical protein